MSKRKLSSYKVRSLTSFSLTTGALNTWLPTTTSSRPSQRNERLLGPTHPSSPAMSLFGKHVLNLAYVMNLVVLVSDLVTKMTKSFDLRNFLNDFPHKVHFDITDKGIQYSLKNYFVTFKKLLLQMI